MDTIRLSAFVAQSKLIWVILFWYGEFGLGICEYFLELKPLSVDAAREDSVYKWLSGERYPDSEMKIFNKSKLFAAKVRRRRRRRRGPNDW